jgi:hypothetical protein
MNPRFGIGQRVHLSLGIIHPGKTVTCHILERLPFEEGNFHYRVKSADEEHDRRASESDLTLLSNV